MKKIDSIRCQHVYDEFPDLSYLEDIPKAADRLANYGDLWVMIGIRASARIVIDGVIQEITSGGLWGIESDSDRQYLQEVEAEELAALNGILAELGFSRRAIQAATNNAERGEA